MEIPRGMGVAKAKLFKEKYGAKLEFPEGWGSSIKRTLCEGGTGMDIFWNHTLKQYSGTFHDLSVVIT